MQKRWKRLLRHFSPSASDGAAGTYPDHIGWRTMEFFLLLADCFCFPEFLLLLNGLLKRNTRRLTQREIETARLIFKEHIDYQKVRIDERARIGCRPYHLAYVGFNCINCWGPISDPHFIHEMVHVWQFQQQGSVYIPRALFAQRTREGYDYGGIAGLAGKRRLQDFNYEQQGDIVADYYRLLHGLKPRYCPADTAYIGVFQKMISESFTTSRQFSVRS